jgi:hypothetical protein
MTFEVSFEYFFWHANVRTRTGSEQLTHHYLTVLWESIYEMSKFQSKVLK